MPDDWPRSVRLTTPRLSLDPLRIEDADELAVLLDDVELHRYMGGLPDLPDQLQRRIVRQVVGRSADGEQLWFNWVLRPLDQEVVVGQLQATVQPSDPAGPVNAVASLAWLIGSAYQGHGFAREAAGAVARWVRGFDYVRLEAYIHPKHEASIAVARSIGLTPTADVVDGEIRWADG